MNFNLLPNIGNKEWNATEAGFGGLVRDNNLKGGILRWLSTSDWDKASDAKYGTVGTSSNTMPSIVDKNYLYGPDDGTPTIDGISSEFSTKVILSMSVDTMGPACFSCATCFDADGDPKFNLILVNTTTNEIISDQVEDLGATDGNSTNMHFVACGKFNSCGSAESPDTKLDTDNAAVRCCSDSDIPSWSMHPGCSIWTESDGVRLGSCSELATFAEAEARCADAGARLCTAEELESNCASGTGCGYDSELVWSSDLAILDAPWNKWSPTYDPNYVPPSGKDYEWRSVLACPDFCLDEENQVRESDLQHLHQFALATDGFEDPCDGVLGANESTTDCNGRRIPEFGDIPKSPVFR